MESITPFIDIRSISEQLTNPQINQNHAEKLINEIFQHYELLTNLPQYADGFTHYAAVPTKNGKALSLLHAAQCLLDYQRTRYFLSGIKDAIDDKLSQKQNTPLRILYAGCGPFAPLFTLIAPLYSSDQIQFEILEVNSTSLQVARDLTEKLELSTFVRDFIEADAITYQIPHPETVDILISETLDSLLSRESYVPIKLNFSKQLTGNAIFIPENVTLKINLKSEINGEETEMFLGEIFNTNKKIDQYISTNSKADYFESVACPIHNNPNYKGLVFDTLVHVYRTTFLGRMQSSITLPYEMKFEHPLTFSKLIFTYEMAPTLELKCDFE